MTLTVTPGWWLLPLALTVLVAWVVHAKLDRSPSHGYGHIGKGLGNALVALTGVVAVLLVWTTYLLLRLWGVL